MLYCQSKEHKLLSPRISRTKQAHKQIIKIHSPFHQNTIGRNQTSKKTLSIGKSTPKLISRPIQKNICQYSQNYYYKTPKAEINGIKINIQSFPTTNTPKIVSRSFAEKGNFLSSEINRDYKLQNRTRSLRNNSEQKIQSKIIQQAQNALLTIEKTHLPTTPNQKLSIQEHFINQNQQQTHQQQIRIKNNLLQKKEDNNSPRQMTTRQNTEQSCIEHQHQSQSQQCELTCMSEISTKSMILQIESQIVLEKKEMKKSAFISTQVVQSLPTIERLQKHLKIIQKCYCFAQENNNFHQNLKQWQQLNFLLLKKYYLEHTKMIHFLKKYPMRNPFKLNGYQISTKQILVFMKTDEGSTFLSGLQHKNKRIKEQLSFYYNMFSKSKVGEQINLFQTDNFSRSIIQQLWAQFILTQYNLTLQKAVIDCRLSQILQLIFLLSQLNGQFLVAIDSLAIAIKNNNLQHYLKYGKDIFYRELQYK